MRVKVKSAALAVIGLASIGALRSVLRAEQEQPSRSVWEGVYTEEQAKRGAELYAEECSSCHGPLLTGGGEEAPALSGPGFLANWNGLTVGDLFERVRLSMPPNKKGRLSREKNVDILTHVLRVNGFPPGKTELPRETERLKQIRVESTKP